MHTLFPPSGQILYLIETLHIDSELIWLLAVGMHHAPHYPTQNTLASILKIAFILIFDISLDDVRETNQYDFQLRKLYR